MHAASDPGCRTLEILEAALFDGDTGLTASYCEKIGKHRLCVNGAQVSAMSHSLRTCPQDEAAVLGAAVRVPCGAGHGALADGRHHRAQQRRQGTALDRSAGSPAGSCADHRPDGAPEVMFRPESAPPYSSSKAWSFCAPHTPAMRQPNATVPERCTGITRLPLLSQDHDNRFWLRISWTCSRADACPRSRSWARMRIPPLSARCCRGSTH